MPDFLITISEIMIFICGAGSILLLNLNNKYSKYGVFIGLLSQPFWFISAANSQSWGIFAVSFIYTASYLTGIYNFWIRINRTNKIKKGKEKCSR
ncbi:MAG: hypothetical protein LBJ73_00340 [Rickettsiales bacterium]|jgi:hypothetical protein|nr:hypothetical protein [Rickettsiales bacterium]